MLVGREQALVFNTLTLPGSGQGVRFEKERGRNLVGDSLSPPWKGKDDRSGRLASWLSFLLPFKVQVDETDDISTMPRKLRQREKTTR